MKVSIYDVAKKAGVSVVTVSRVINNAPTVRQSSREKVMKAIEELNYQPSAAARSLAKGKTNVIGLIIPNLTDTFFMEVVAQVDNELEKRGYFLALSVIDKYDDDHKSRCNFFFQQERVDGILVMTPQFEDEYVQELKSKNIPFVLLDNQHYPFKEASIVVDNFKGGYEVARHLLELGHTDIGFIGGPKDSLSATQRWEGFTKALDEVGIQPSTVNWGEFDIANGYSTLHEWAKEDMVPKAIFAADDYIAFGAIDALRELGKKVPEDVSIVGYDDHPFCSQLHPFLSTVKQPAVNIGTRGVETLFEIMKEGGKKNVVIKLEPEFIPRESSASPSISD